MFSVDQVVADKLPRVNRRPLLARTLKSVLRNLLHEQAFQDFGRQYPHLEGIDFVDQVLEYFNFSYSVRECERENIPASGRVVIISNHPIGSLDGLALIKLISDIRPDLKVVVNSLLSTLKVMDSLLLPVHNMGSTKTPQENIRAIHDHLNNEKAILIFPAGEVSRLRPNGVRDCKWQGGFLRFAEATHSPILPIFVDARVSSFFYGVSMMYKPASTLLLVKEMFKQRNKNIKIRIGEIVPYSGHHPLAIDKKAKVKLFKRHLYRIGKDKPAIFATEKAIVHPESRSEINRAVQQCELLGETGDGKQIFLYRHGGPSAIMREIGRLRELSFRAVGEGTGRKRDIDKYDSHYMHIVLWDRDDLEIAGAYRMADTHDIVERFGIGGLYSSELFDYSEAMQPFLRNGLELGRSFVQPKYWGKRSLDYLWYGIGALLQRYPQYRYLFGPVTISGKLPVQAKTLLVNFYQTYFADADDIARAKVPFWECLAGDNQLAQVAFTGTDYREEFTLLKHTLANMGVSVPTLYKQYSEACEPGGVRFADFSIDPAFQNCIDGLVMVDSHRLTAHKRRRYLGEDTKVQRIGSARWHSSRRAV